MTRLTVGVSLKLQLDRLFHVLTCCRRVVGITVLSVGRIILELELVRRRQSWRRRVPLPLPGQTSLVLLPLVKNGRVLMVKFLRLGSLALRVLTCFRVRFSPNSIMKLLMVPLLKLSMTCVPSGRAYLRVVLVLMNRSSRLMPLAVKRVQLGYVSHLRVMRLSLMVGIIPVIRRRWGQWGRGKPWVVLILIFLMTRFVLTRIILTIGCLTQIQKPPLLLPGPHPRVKVSIKFRLSPLGSKDAIEAVYHLLQVIFRLNLPHRVRRYCVPGKRGRSHGRFTGLSFFTPRRSPGSALRGPGSLS